MADDGAVIKRLTEEVFLDGNLAPIEDLVSDDFVDHDPPPGVPPTKEGFRLLAEMIVGVFSDRKAEFDEFIDTADGRVVENWAMTATHTGEAFGLPASGKSIRGPRRRDLSLRGGEGRGALGCRRHERRRREGARLGIDRDRAAPSRSWIVSVLERVAQRPRIETKLTISPG